MDNCAICQLHADPPLERVMRFIDRSFGFCVITLTSSSCGRLLLDSRRHCSGPLDFSEAEASEWGSAVRDASRLVKQITGCDRVYAIAFGEGAQHLHLHLIPRHLDEPATKAWAVADLYREMTSGNRAAADSAVVASLVERCRSLLSTRG